MIAMVKTNALIEWYGNYVLQHSTNLLTTNWVFVAQGIGGIMNISTIRSRRPQRIISSGFMDLRTKRSRQDPKNEATRAREDILELKDAAHLQLFAAVSLSRVSVAYYYLWLAPVPTTPVVWRQAKLKAAHM
jgi:hypothetical protein